MITAITVTFVLSCKNKKETENSMSTNENKTTKIENTEVQKVDSNDDVIIWQNLASTKMSVPELTDYARRYLVDQYSTLGGVARVRVGGGLSYAMRIWLDRKELAARNLIHIEVIDASEVSPLTLLQRKNVVCTADALKKIEEGLQ